MLSLRDIQLRGRQAFLSGDTDALSRSLLPDADALIAGISVYQNNARETFRQALAESYPIVAALTGDQCFAGLAATYVQAHPSRTPDLQDFGARFPEFLERCYARSAHQYLPDVARLELASEQVLLERETPPLDIQVLANLPTSELPKLRLIRSPASRLVASEFPILDIWRMHFHDDVMTVSLDSGPSQVAVVRQSDDSVLRPLSALEFSIAERLTTGEPLGDVFDRLHAACDSADLQSALVKLLRYRLFSEFDIGSRRLI